MRCLPFFLVTFAIASTGWTAPIDDSDEDERVEEHFDDRAVELKSTGRMYKPFSVPALLAVSQPIYDRGQQVFIKVPVAKWRDVVSLRWLPGTWSWTFQAKLKNGKVLTLNDPGLVTPDEDQNERGVMLWYFKEKGQPMTINQIEKEAARSWKSWARQKFGTLLRDRMPGNFFDAHSVSDPKGLRDFFVDMLVDRCLSLSYDEQVDLQDVLEKSKSLKRGALMRTVLPRLGPAYVKLGQLLGNRPELIHSAEDREELLSLSDQVPEVPFNVAKKVIEKELGKPLDKVFQHLNPKPAGTGSVGQAHEGKLLNGEVVMAKFLKPNVARQLRGDLRRIDHFLGKTERGEAGAKEEFARVLRPVVQDLKEDVARETDLREERKATVRIRRNLKESGSEMEMPRTFKELSTSGLLLESKAPGASITAHKLTPAAAQALAEKPVVAILEQILDDHFFHGDPHQGNIFHDPESGRTSFIDAGLHSEITEAETQPLIELAMGLSTSQRGTVESALRSLLGKQASEEEVRAIVDKSMSTVGVPASEQLRGLLRNINLERKRLPKGASSALTALIRVEGVARKLDPKFELQSAVGTYMARKMARMARAPMPKAAAARR